MTRIKIADLREEDQVLDIELSPEFLLGDVQEDIEFEPATGKVKFHLAGEEVLAMGKLNSAVTLPCARCLEKVRIPLEAPITLTFWPHKRANAAEETDEEFDPHEPDLAFYRGDVVRPDEDLRELVVVEAPLLVYCKKDCKGICQTCGANLNETTCDCPPLDTTIQTESPTKPSWKEQLKNIDLEE
ncbi:MAG: YceD family protein [Candidatus Sumerlaeota bacterium]